MPEDSQTENIVLENLRRIRAQLDKIEGVLEQHTEQFSELRRSIATVRRDQAADAESVAVQSNRFDRFERRLTRIERRLELRDDA